MMIYGMLQSRWGSLRRIHEAWQRCGAATLHSSSKPGLSSEIHANKHMFESVTNLRELVGSHSIASRIPLYSLKVYSVPHVWDTVGKPRMSRELISLFQVRVLRYDKSGNAMRVLGNRAQFFSSQAEVAAKQGSQGARLTMESQRAGKKKSEALLMYLVAMVTAMVGITYAAVPLYRKFCQATGYGGTVQRRETVEEKIARHTAEEAAAPVRELVVQFNADVADGLPWKFTPCQRELRVRPGQSTLAFYTAENNSSMPITGVSTYNVTPMKAGIYFNKIQCFCFEEQRLLAGEKIDMPVFFYIDPEFAADPKMNGVNNLILSYTFFKVEEESQQAEV